MAARCGEWEAEARGQGIVIRDIDGLTLPDLLTLPGCDPVLLIPDWRMGRTREEACAWGLCELHREARGIEDARQQIGRSVAAVGLALAAAALLLDADRNGIADLVQHLVRAVAG